MSSQDAARKGRQRPRLEHYPAYFTTAGQDVADLAALAGLDLLDWQKYVLEKSLGEQKGGHWAASEVGLIVPRQNGKNVILEARELAGLFLLGENLLIHTAHEFKTAGEAFLSMKNRILSCPDLAEYVLGWEGDPDANIRGIRTAHGFEAIELKTGRRLKYATRTAGAGRGFTADFLALDEAYALTEEQQAAIFSTLAARSLQGSPQIWYTSSAGMPASTVLARLRERGMSKDGEDGLAYFEWSAADEADPEDKDTWALANPSLGYFISEGFVASEKNALDEEKFKRERLGIWAEEAEDPPVIAPSDWQACFDNASQIGQSVCFGVDIPPSRESAVIAAASLREDGMTHVEIVEQDYGTSWLPARLQELQAAYPTSKLVIDAGGAVGALEADLARFRVRANRVGGRDYGQACGLFFDLSGEHKLRHIGKEQLTDAVSAARIQPMSESLWKWKRKHSLADISPLVATSLAVLGAHRLLRKRKQGRRRLLVV